MLLWTVDRAKGCCVQNGHALATAGINESSGAFKTYKLAKFVKRLIWSLTNPFKPWLPRSLQRNINSWKLHCYTGCCQELDLRKNEDKFASHKTNVHSRYDKGIPILVRTTSYSFPSIPAGRTTWITIPSHSIWNTKWVFQRPHSHNCRIISRQKMDTLTQCHWYHRWYSM